MRCLSAFAQKTTQPEARLRPIQFVDTAQLFGISLPDPKLASIWLKIVGSVYPPTPQDAEDDPSE